MHLPIESIFQLFAFAQSLSSLRQFVTVFEPKQILVTMESEGTRNRPIRGYKHYLLEMGFQPKPSSRERRRPSRMASMGSTSPSSPRSGSHGTGKQSPVARPPSPSRSTSPSRSGAGSPQGKVVLGYKYHLRRLMDSSDSSPSPQSRKGFPMRSSFSPERMSRHQRLGLRRSASRPRRQSMFGSSSAPLRSGGSQRASPPLSRTSSLRRRF